eukprot:gene154-162_t
MSDKTADEIIEATAISMGVDKFSKEFPLSLDKADSLHNFRSEFLFPTNTENNLLSSSSAAAAAAATTVYLCGNSLGLQPKKTKEEVVNHLDKWAQQAVEGHFTGDDMWVEVESPLNINMANLVGALPSEVVLMNTLTCNLHLMMIAFYRPTVHRFKILIEKKAFPSDYHAVISQIQLHGYDPSISLIEMTPRDGEVHLREEDIESLLIEQGESISLVLFSGIQYYTGQLFDMEKITRWAKAAGCQVGFDLAHAVGNVPLQLHEWGCDFACWCTYKYMNSGPGCIGGCFVHERHGRVVLEGEGIYQQPVPRRLAGWWGHRIHDRFQMEPSFTPEEGARGFRLSNPPVLEVACVKASLDVFAKADIHKLREKSILLTAYLEVLLMKELHEEVEIFTPREVSRRGCQLSLAFRPFAPNQLLVDIDLVVKELKKNGIICDARKPNVMRVAPTPLYNSFEDVYRFVQVLKQVLTVLQSS